jgi:uncharacterized protein (DUF302 family)
VLTDREVGLMLLCKVIVYEDEFGETAVEAIDPTRTEAARSDPEITRIAAEVRRRLERALDRIGRSGISTPSGEPGVTMS